MITPLDIPAGKSGDWEVKHIVKPPGTKLSTANLRTSLFGGDDREEYVYTHETRWHQLCEGEGVWMSDLPIEQAQHMREVEGMTGNVLVGGLGLGLACKFLLKTADHITVVEQSADVIKLVGPSLNSHIEVVHADLFEYLQEPEFEPCDYGFYDIWCSDGEGTFHDMVVPLHELSEDIVGKVVCWNENVMRGQLVMGLDSSLRFMQPDLQEQFKDHKTPTLAERAEPINGPGSIYWNWSVPFFRWVRDAKVPLEKSLDLARVYAGSYGLPGFMEEWDDYAG